MDQARSQIILGGGGEKKKKKKKGGGGGINKKTNHSKMGKDRNICIMFNPHNKTQTNQ